jgi:hypothetical protein
MNDVVRLISFFEGKRRKMSEDDNDDRVSVPSCSFEDMRNEVLWSIVPQVTLSDPFFSSCSTTASKSAKFAYYIKEIGEVVLDASVTIIEDNSVKKLDVHVFFTQDLLCDWVIATLQWDRTTATNLCRLGCKAESFSMRVDCEARFYDFDFDYRRLTIRVYVINNPKQNFDIKFTPVELENWIHARSILPLSLFPPPDCLLSSVH